MLDEFLNHFKNIGLQYGILSVLSGLDFVFFYRSELFLPWKAITESRANSKSYRIKGLSKKFKFNNIECLDQMNGNIAVISVKYCTSILSAFFSGLKSVLLRFLPLHSAVCSSFLQKPLIGHTTLTFH